MNVLKLLIISVLCGASFSASAGYWCGSPSSGSGAERYEIISIKEVVRREGDYFRFGFNLESFLFDSIAGVKIIDLLGSRFDGDVRSAEGFFLRYPGGSISDRINLLDTVGPDRKVLKMADWAKPQTLRFGLAEYLDFVSLTAARSWLVLNVVDSDQKAAPEVLAEKNAQVLDMVRERAELGHAELGNEPYMPRHRLDGRAYGERLRPTLDMMQKRFADVRPVLAMMGHDIGGNNARRYNQDVIEVTGNPDVDFALHYYYDGPPGGPSMVSTLSNLCARVRDLKQLTGRNPSIWVTEHGRWPGGKVDEPDWQLRWPNTYNFGAALSVAEFVIGAALIPEVKGVFLHALGGTRGPWPMYQQNGTDGDFYPTAPMLAQAVLYPLSRGDIQATEISTPEIDGGAGLRAAFVLLKLDEMGLALVSRLEKMTKAQLIIPAYAGMRVHYRANVVSATSVEAVNVPGQASPVKQVMVEGELNFSVDGRAELPVPALSVAFIRFTSKH